MTDQTPEPASTSLEVRQMQQLHPQQSNNFGLGAQKLRFPRKAVIGVILIVALLAFEIFNFDTTRYALQNLMGDVEFMRLPWAGILALAFCAIDFAGLVKIFTPEQGINEHREVWYLMGAWLLGATMNAVMTWWAVSLTLLNHEFGNEVLSREQLLRWVPIFVAVLVWLTRILFIGAFSVAGEHIFDFNSAGVPTAAAKPQPQPQPAPAAPRPLRANNGAPKPASTPAPRPAPMAAKPAQTQSGMYAAGNAPSYLEEHEPVPAQPTQVNPRPGTTSGNSRVQQRPPMPSVRRVPVGGVQAKNRR